MKETQIAAKWIVEIFIPMKNKGIDILEYFGLNFNANLARMYYANSKQRKTIEALVDLYKLNEDMK